MNIAIHCLVSLLAIIFGQIANHLNKKLPPVVSEEITYKEFFKTLKTGFKIDIIFSAVFVLLFNCFVYFLGNNLQTYLYMIISFALSLAFTIDFKFQLIPDEVHIVVVFAAIINFAFNIQNWWDYLLGAVIGGAIFWGLGLLSLLIFKKEGMGFGDVKLMAALGLMFGMKNILVIALVSFFLGGIIGAVVLIIKNKDSDGYIPFGPFIVIATIIVIFVKADPIIEVYIGFCSWLGMKMSDAVFMLMNKFSN